MPSIPDIDADFLDFLRLLTVHKVRYVVVGGYAVALYGYVRYTGDIDVFVESSNANAKKLVQVFKEFGYDVPNLSEELFSTAGKLIRVGRPPNRLEVLTQISGVTFGECYRDRVVCRAEDVDVNFVSKDLLLRNKKASGRPKDLVDVEHLLKGQTDSPLTAKPFRSRPSQSSAAAPKNRKRTNE
ncbi:MAG: hypothetical protein HZA46_12045, partial [Planctomycetales bacterium]|nr:hypothetical protein [Planctomycetales bacterium]